MRRVNQKLQLVLAVLMFLSLCATSAQAVLRDFGPINPVGGYPTWYRDNNGIAVQQCLSKAVSPISSLPLCNLLAFPNTSPPFNPALPITFAPNPAVGYNWPLETFYFSLSTDKLTFVSPTFPAAKPLILLALEGSFANNINPIPGDQIVFSRVRIDLIGFPSGQYTITHPFGVDVMNVISTDIKTQKFTRDVGLAGVRFTGALAGDIGPYLSWTPDAPQVALGHQNADGTIPGLTPVTLVPNGEVHLGDFNVAHTFQGSPFGTNFFRIQGPIGSNIGGGGSDILNGTLGILEGQKFTAPIPSPLTIDRMTYRRDTVTGQMDVFATSSPLSNQGTPSSLTITGANIIPATGVVMTKDAVTGKFFAHIDNVPPSLFPAQLTVTNTADVPPTAVIGDLVDEVFISAATYEPISKTLTITAASGDLLNNPPPAITADLFGTVPANAPLVVAGVLAPPPSIHVVSAAHGSATRQLLVQAFPPPVAGNDAAGILNTNPLPSNVVIDVLANDSATAPATLDPSKVVVVTAPTIGATTVNTTTGAITYALNPPAFVGPGSDAFSYTVTDSNGVTSLPATVTITITSANIPPVANNDTASGTTAAPIIIPVLANDTSVTSTLDPTQISIITAPAAPAIATPGVGNVSFSSVTPGIYSFQYTVKDTYTTPATSNVATVVVTITAPVVPPTAVNDPGATVTSGSSVVINVAGNDTVGTNPLNSASVAVAAAPANGTAIANAGGAGTITYTPNAGFAGVDTFTYNIKDTLGNVSLTNATVTVTVSAPTTETINITRAQYTLSSGQWRVDGTTTARVAGQTMKIFNTATVPADPSTGFLAQVTVAGNGSFTWTSPNLTVAPNALRKFSVLSSLNPNNNKKEQVTVTVR